MPTLHSKKVQSRIQRKEKFDSTFLFYAHKNASTITAKKIHIQITSFGPDACLRQAGARRIEGMGHQEVPEHEAPLRAGKGKRTKTGTGKERKERKCSLNLMLEQTIFRKPLDSTLHLDKV